jgi:hypothetical protein
MDKNEQNRRVWITHSMSAGEVRLAEEFVA